MQTGKSCSLIILFELRLPAMVCSLNKRFINILLTGTKEAYAWKRLHGGLLVHILVYNV